MLRRYTTLKMAPTLELFREFSSSKMWKVVVDPNTVVDERVGSEG